MFGWGNGLKKRDPPKKRRRKQKMEFSKKILVVTCLFAIMIFGYAMWIQYLIIIKEFHGDTGIVLALIGVAGGEIVTGVGFYYKKAERENIEREKRKTLRESKKLGIVIEEDELDEYSN